MATDEYSKFGISKESYDKSKNILPTFDLGKIEVGSDVFLTVQSKEPEVVEHPDKFDKDKKKGEEPKKIKTNVLKVLVTKINRASKDGMIEMPMDDKMTLWLSSKSLAMGMLKAYKENDNNLEDVKVKINVSIAEYKEFGENRCYNVTSLGVE